MNKHIGWFDRRENAAGVLTSFLAKDIQLINGASTYGAACVFESFFALVMGLAIGFVYSWKLALVGLFAAPFMIAGGFINSRFSGSQSQAEEDAFNEANLLLGDVINNHRTIASFGYDDLVVNQYD